MNPDLLLIAWDWFMLAAGYVSLFLVASFALTLLVSAICKLLRTLCYVFTGRFDEIGA